MFSRIQSIQVLEILDSHSNPTVWVKVLLDNGLSGTVSVLPSALTRKNKVVVELCDGNRSISAPIGLGPRKQEEIDLITIEPDGTSNKAKLGTNTILGVPQAVALAAAQACDLPLYVYLGGIGRQVLPVPMINTLNDGKHADRSVDFQEFIIFPIGALNFTEALRYGAETFYTLKKILSVKGYVTVVGDKSLAPQARNNEKACELIVEAIVGAGYQPGKDIAIALDPAASSFYENGKYRLAQSEQEEKTSSEMTAIYMQWIEECLIISIEDGDCQDFREQTAVLGNKMRIVDSDNLATNTYFIARAIASFPF